MINLIPMPANIISTNDYYSFEKSSATVFFSSELESISPMFESIMGFSFEKSKNSPCISFIYDDSEEIESYSLIVDKSGARVFASSCCGAFYAAQTLRQLFEADIKGKKRLASQYVKISGDRPQYRWRGLQLDEGRHFFGKETVKRLLDLMAMYKLNVFHWHLTDDQGWRIEIKKYPLLTEIGSKREKSQIRNWNSTETDETPVEGYYTAQDIKEIVQYAKERFIEIVPEIDFPAHSAAVLASYNNLACRDIPCEVPFYFGERIPKEQGNKSWNRTLCLGKDKVYRFVFDVIDEVAALFPSKYFHVGGDEAPTDEWKKCPLCQQKIKDQKLSNETQLQGYFTGKVNEHLRSIGKTMVGWNEILKSDSISNDIVVQYWTPQRDRRVADYLKFGGKVVLSCHKAFYFDMPFKQVSVKNTYNFNPFENNVPKDCLHNVLGIEGENWTEWTNSEKQLFFKLIPRIQALCENAWTEPKRKNYRSFVNRFQRHKLYLESLGIYFGSDKITLHDSILYKSQMTSRLGISMKDYDAEYKISLCE